jgi:Peptidase_C39 like family
VFALLIGVACFAPITPAALAPVAPADNTLSGPATAPTQSLPAAVSKPLQAAPRAATTPVPTIAPTPFVVPTLTAGGIDTLNAIRSDKTAQWVRNHTQTPLHSGPSDTSPVFTMLPQWSMLKQIGGQPDWLMVQYSGDGDTRQPGPGWVKASDVGGVDAPSVWLSTAAAGTLWSTWDASATRVLDLPGSTLMEVQSGADFISGTRVHVRLPGNGRSVPPAEGWVDGNTVARAATPSAADLPKAYPADLKADVRINVPYRTQLDGSDFASANCGPTVLGMALESFGVNQPPPELRSQVLNTEEFDPTDTDAGSYIWALADVARSYGLQPHGLYDADGSLHQWSTDDIRASLQHGQPVVVQVVYRALPGRQDSGYYGDHFIILTGLVGDQFLYNDPIGGRAANEIPGYDRVMTAAQLQRAMRASDTTYAFSAFGLSRN